MRHIPIALVAIVLVTIFASVTEGQTSGISGSVYDLNGAIVIGTDFFNVTKDGSKLLATSDDNGKFSINLGTGLHTILIKQTHGFFCPILLVNYRVVGGMKLDIVFSNPTINMDASRCKARRIVF